MVAVLSCLEGIMYKLKNSKNKKNILKRITFLFDNLTLLIKSSNNKKKNLNECA